MYILLCALSPDGQGKIFSSERSLLGVGADFPALFLAVLLMADPHQGLRTQREENCLVRPTWFQPLESSQMTTGGRAQGT